MVKTSSERFQGLVKLIRLCSYVCGADVVDPNYRINILTFIVLLAIHSFYCFTIYTIYVGVFLEGEWTILLQSLCMVGSAVQGFAKLMSGICRKVHLRVLVEGLSFIYEEYEKKHERYKFYLNKSINVVSKIIRSIAMMYLIITCILILVPLYFRYFHGRREFVMQFLLPGVNPNTPMGYIILNSVQITCLTFGSFGNFAGDMYFFTFTSHMPLLQNILKCKLEDLNVIVRDEQNDERNSTELLKDVFQWHQHCMEYISVIKDIYFWVIVVQIITISASIGCTMFCILLGKWPVGFLYLLYCFVMLYIYCGLGTLVEISNDGFTESCYLDAEWYKYSIEQQKMIQIMLRTSQNSSGLTVGSVLPLSVSTGLQVTKTVYTFTMMLINFLD